MDERAIQSCHAGVTGTARNVGSHGSWSTGRNKSILPCDRCYLVMQGKEPRAADAPGAKGKLAVAQHAHDTIVDDHRSRGCSGLTVNMSYNEVEFANIHAREYE